MTIKKKDGTPYKLHGPNPIMNKQVIWDDAVVHNFSPQEITTLQDIEPEEIHVAIKSLPPDKIENPTKRKQPDLARRVKMNVLPAIVNKHYDPLYGEDRSSIAYKEKITCELIVIKQEDLEAVFWYEQEIGIGSIIYVERRWWQVKETSRGYDGWMMSCSPSALQPSF